jgi:hypothetical protein
LQADAAQTAWTMVREFLFSPLGPLPKGEESKPLLPRGEGWDEGAKWNLTFSFNKFAKAQSKDCNLLLATASA